MESVEGQAVRNRLELELALLDKRQGDSVQLGCERNGMLIAHSIKLAGGSVEGDTNRAAWEQLGVRLSVVSDSALALVGEGYKYTGGLRINEVRPGSPADKARLTPGDIIVGVMDWQTPELKHLAWILENPSFRSAPTSKYYLVRKRARITVAMGLESAVPSSISRNGSKDVR